MTEQAPGILIVSSTILEVLIDKILESGTLIAWQENGNFN